MPREQTAFDSRSSSDEEKYREKEMGAGASSNNSGPDPSTKAPGKFNVDYDTAKPGFTTNT